jgi:hypothetical protein
VKPAAPLVLERFRGQQKDFPETYTEPQTHIPQLCSLSHQRYNSDDDDDDEDENNNSNSNNNNYKYNYTIISCFKTYVLLANNSVAAGMCDNSKQFSRNPPQGGERNPAAARRCVAGATEMGTWDIAGVNTLRVATR